MKPPIGAVFTIGFCTGILVAGLLMIFRTFPNSAYNGLKREAIQYKYAEWRWIVPPDKKEIPPRVLEVK